MISLDKIVNLKKHPINQSKDYIKYCSNKLTKYSILQLDDFLTAEALKILQIESENLHNKAFYCSQLHTILLNKKNNDLSKDDPCNIEVKSDKGCVPHDLIPKNSYLNYL